MSTNHTGMHHTCTNSNDLTITNLEGGYVNIVRGTCVLSDRVRARKQWLDLPLECATQCWYVLKSCSLILYFILLVSNRLCDVESQHCQLQKEFEIHVHLAKQQTQQACEVSCA